MTTSGMWSHVFEEFQSSNCRRLLPTRRRSMPKKLDHTAAIAHLSSVDRALAKIIAKAGPCGLQPEQTQSLFESLMEAIIYQQLNGKVAAIIPSG